MAVNFLPGRFDDLSFSEVFAVFGEYIHSVSVVNIWRVLYAFIVDCDLAVFGHGIDRRKRLKVLFFFLRGSNEVQEQE